MAENAKNNYYLNNSDDHILITNRKISGLCSRHLYCSYTHTSMILKQEFLFVLLIIACFYHENGIAENAKIIINYLKDRDDHILITNRKISGLSTRHFHTSRVLVLHDIKTIIFATPR